MKSAPPSFDFFPSDFIAKTAHMTTHEVGCYIRLLCQQWFNTTLPRDMSQLSRMCICSLEDFQKAWPALEPKFENCDDSGDAIQNPRLSILKTQTVERYSKMVKNARKNGKKGGRPKKTHSVLKKNPLLEGGRRKEDLNLKENGVLKIRSVNQDIAIVPVPSPVIDDLGIEVLAAYERWANVRVEAHQVDFHTMQHDLLLQQLSKIDAAVRLELLETAAMNGWKTLDNGAAKELIASKTQFTVKF